jgi:hypothetical protein
MVGASQNDRLLQCVSRHCLPRSFLGSNNKEQLAQHFFTRGEHTETINDQRVNGNAILGNSLLRRMHSSVLECNRGIE